MALFDQLIQPALDSVTKLIDQFHLSPEEKAQAQQAIADAAQKAQADAENYNVQLNSIAGQNIRAEETNNDKYTERARPTVIWMGCGLIAWNYGIVPVFCSHWHLNPVTLPDAFWWTWGTVVTGYVFSRGMEKVAQMPGDSQITLPLGLGKVSNTNKG